MNVNECAVCSDKADGFHYGVLSCRGCNAFFRRAVTCKLNFYCRHGGNCVVDKNARCACRACRFEKCKRIGMDVFAVQMSRTKGDEIIGDYQDGSFNDSLALFYLEPSTPPAIPLRVYCSAEVLHSLIGYQENTAGAGYVQRLIHRYLDQRLRRRALFCNSLKQFLSDKSGIYLTKLATKEDIAEVYQTQLFVMFEWLQTQKEFHLISPNDKVMLMGCFSLNYVILDILFMTLELGYSDRLVLANRSFIKAQPEPVVTMEHSATVLMYSENFLGIINDVLRPMIDINLTFGELVALRQIMFWAAEPHDLTEETKKIQKEVIQRTYRDLDLWLKSNSIHNTKSRIESILLLVDRIRKYAKLLSKITSFIPGLTLDSAFFNEFL